MTPANIWATCFGGWSVFRRGDPARPPSHDASVVRPGLADTANDARRAGRAAGRVGEADRVSSGQRAATGRRPARGGEAPPQPAHDWGLGVAFAHGSVPSDRRLQDFLGVRWQGLEPEQD